MVKRLADLKLVLVDDEPLALERLRKLLNQLGCRQIIGEYQSADELLSVVDQRQVDVILLDLHMPGQSGLEVIQALNKIPSAPTVVVTTAWMEHALQAYGPLTVAYLLKPIEPDALLNALNKALLYIQQRNAAQKDDRFDDRFTEQSNIVLITHQGRHSQRILAGDVVVIKAEHKHACAYCKDGRHFWLNESLNQLTALLDPLFIRIHRATAINRQEMESLHSPHDTKGRSPPSLMLGMRYYPELLEVSRAHRRTVRDLFHNNADITH